MLITVYWSSCEIPVILSGLMKLPLPPHIFEKNTHIKFHENSSSGNRVVPCERTDGPTDTTKLIIAFRNFAKAPKNDPN